jgi:hypothetical protein
MFRRQIFPLILVDQDIVHIPDQSQPKLAWANKQLSSTNRSAFGAILLPSIEPIHADKVVIMLNRDLSEALENSILFIVEFVFLLTV